MENKKSAEIKYETTLPKEIKGDVTTTKNLEMEFLYGSPLIPAGSHFEILDDIEPGDVWLLARITNSDNNELEVFYKDISNLPRGFLSEEEWREEGDEDLSDVISISLKWWKENLMTEKECAELLGLEVFFFRRRCSRKNVDAQ